MATYRLLRNNKESGPHSLDELRNLGLKAYDLVWVDGKSAAWRYPGELEEFKAFAPQVEEQPYDRFYKKPSSDTSKQEIKKETTPLKEVQPVKETQPVKATQPAQDAYAVAPEHEKYTPAKSVFVTMPNKKNNTVKPVVKEESNTIHTAPVTSNTEPVQQTISVTENPVAAAQVKYSQPLDEIKEMYVKTLYDRKQKMARKTFWLQSLKKVAVILLLIAVGVVAGFLIKSKGKDQSLVETDTPLNAQKQGAVTAPVILGSNTGNVSDTAVKNTEIVLPRPDQYVNETTAGEELEPKQPLVIRTKPVNNTDKKTTEPSVQEESNTALSPGAMTDPATGERGRRARNESGGSSSENERERKSFSSSDISGLVHVTSNDYKKVAFGGIRNLELTVTNDSKYTLDNVVVELQYIKPNELPLRTEKVEFKSIGPKSTSTVRIPDTNRGIKVTYRIINIRSSQMDEVATGN